MLDNQSCKMASNKKVILSYTCIATINILRIAKRVPVEHPQFASENN